MKTKGPFNSIKTTLIALGLVACGAGTVIGQDAVYAARLHLTNSGPAWSPPFYWIDLGGGSAYGTSTSQSNATNPVTPSRAGSYIHTASNLPVGEGYGLVHVNGTQAGAVYEVQVTQPSYQLVPDIVMSVGSTNCDIGDVFGATAGGGWTNTTAFQAAYSLNQWARVCYLTNRPGITQAHVDFKYVSGGTSGSGYDRTYADCVRFHLIVAGSNAPTPVRITSMAGNSVAYSGGSGVRFVLLRSASLSTTWSSCERLATNSATPGSFTIPAVSTGGPVFYAIASE